ncbi:MAG: hypothetical protein ACTSU9_17320 [Promethearchaeota archaeon]
MMQSLSPIQTRSGKVTDQIFHVNLRQFGMPRLTSAFILETPECVIIMGTGTSDDIRAITRFLKKEGIPLEKVKYLVYIPLIHGVLKDFAYSWRN